MGGRALDEFSLIKRYLGSQRLRRTDVRLGIGDDAAVVIPKTDQELVITTDLLIAGVHFPEHSDARAIGHKAAAVNLSDLAAMGAEPAWASLTLSIPQADEPWLESFCSGLFGLLDRWSVQLIGGDTARGPLGIGVQLCGFVSPGKVLRRSGACVGDDIYVTGTLGDAAASLMEIRRGLGISAAARECLRARLDFPTPRVDEGLALVTLANAAIDVSDGLAADLGHLVCASEVAAEVDLDAIPLSEPCAELVRGALGWTPVIAGGDDYELCFTAPRQAAEAVTDRMAALGTRVTRIGRIVAGHGVVFRDRDGREHRPSAAGYNHFRTHE